MLGDRMPEVQILCPRMFVERHCRSLPSESENVGIIRKKRSSGGPEVGKTEAASDGSGGNRKGRGKGP